MVPDLSRTNNTCLMGKGVICGLEIYLDKDHGILVTHGLGITPTGSIIKLNDSKWFRYYSISEITLPGLDDITLWELHEEKGKNEPLKPQSSEEEIYPFLKNKVLLVAADASDQNQNPEIRLLLAERKDILDNLDLFESSSQQFWKETKDDDDFIYSDDYNPNDTIPSLHHINKAINPVLQLPELYLRRFGFGKGDPFDCPPEGVDTSEFPCFNSIKPLNDLYNTYCIIIEDVIRQLDRNINKLYKEFNKIFGWQEKYPIQEWIALLCDKWEAYKKSNKGEDHKMHYIQYFYDWMRDLVRAYNEIRNEIINLVAFCCTGLYSEKNYLLLGVVLRDDLTRQPAPLRQTFVQPPVFNNNAEQLQVIRLYFWRLLMMIKGFYLPDFINNEKINKHCRPHNADEEELLFGEVKITPGQFYNQLLADQSIPYYYPVTLSRYSVHHFWNYHRTKTSSTDHILSYHASDMEDSYSRVFSTVRPLHYNLDKYSFFRIEGHIGQTLQDIHITTGDNIRIEPGVWSTLKYYKSKYNLPIYFDHISLKDFTTSVNYPTENEELELSKSETDCSLKCKYAGAEHLAGVQKGGTFILVTEKRSLPGSEEEIDVVIADFSLPCCWSDCDKQVVPIRRFEQEIEGEAQEAEFEKKSVTNESKSSLQAELLALIGPSSMEKAHKLEEIKGIGEAYAKRLNALGINTYDQIGKLNEQSLEILDRLWGSKISNQAQSNDWVNRAKRLLKDKS